MKLISRLKIVIPVLLITFVLSACRQSDIYTGPNPININDQEPLLIQNYVRKTDVTLSMANEQIAIIDDSNADFRTIKPRANGSTELNIYVDGLVINTIEVNIRIPDFEFLEASQVSDEDITLEKSGNIVNFSTVSTAILVKFNGENLSIVEQARYEMKFPGNYEFIFKNEDNQPQTIGIIDLDAPNVQLNRDSNSLVSDYYLSTFRLTHNDDDIDFSSSYQIQGIGSHSLLLTYTDQTGELITILDENIIIPPNFRSGVPSSINRPISLRLNNTPERVTINEREVSLNRNNEILIRRRGINEINIYGVNDYVQTYTISYNNQFYNQVMRLNIYWIPILILGIITIGIKIPKVMKR